MNLDEISRLLQGTQRKQNEMIEIVREIKEILKSRSSEFGRKLSRKTSKRRSRSRKTSKRRSR